MMDENKQFIFVVAVFFILVVSGLLTNILNKFETNIIPFIILLVSGYFCYNFRLKIWRKTNLMLTILLAFLLIKQLNSVATKVGGFLIPSIPLLGFLFVFLLCYILVLDYLKYKHVMSRSYVFLIILLLIIFRDKTSGISSFIYDKIPYIGFIILVLVVFVAFKDYKKYKKLIARDYLLSVVVLLLIFREKLSPLKWIESATSYIFKGAGSHALIIGLIIILFVQILLYYILWKPKKEVEKLEYI